MNLNLQFTYQSITEDVSAGYPGDGSTNSLVRTVIICLLKNQEYCDSVKAIGVRLYLYEIGYYVCSADFEPCGWLGGRGSLTVYDTRG